jgi:hypothetical protein
VHGFDTSTPVLRFMPKPVWSDRDTSYVTPYQLLRSLVLLRVRMKITVEGLAALHIRNDEAMLNATKPFEPFGSTPAVGSRFYVGHSEVAGKKLDTLTTHITWMGAPPQLGTYYLNYSADPKSPVITDNTSFVATVRLADRRVLRDFTPALTLFNKDNTATPVAATLTPPTDQGNPASAVTTAADVADWNRYLVWELNAPDFQQSTYASAALRQSLALSAAAANKTTVDPTKFQVNPPYTPKIRSLTLDYTASDDRVLDPASTAPSGIELFHIHPFGYVVLDPPGDAPGVSFLPQYDFEGELFIGLSSVAAPQNVSLLFQVAEGSANPDVVPQPLQWSYLSGDQWVTLQNGRLLSDQTRGLINSGIVELSLPPADPSTMLPPGMYWIRVAIARGSDSVCDIVAIHPNATRATFVDDDNAPDHLSAPLPAKTITAAVAPIAGVSGITQPYTSFGGHVAEGDASFHVRVSERLRHKQRALTPWDYERLVLDAFPDIYKVKCLRADALGPTHAPGGIVLVVIPDIRGRSPSNPFEPKAPADRIADIESFLADKTPPFARVTVTNAHYVPVKVRCGVRFLPGQDQGLARRRLNEELNRFLSPWAFNDGADLVIGGSVYANSIINFIDRRDYVDYIFEFKMFTSENGGRDFLAVPDAGDGNGYRATTNLPDGVLVAAREHDFDVIDLPDYRVESFRGVNYMKIELDFVVG